uniref:LAM_G_DOMAIN domain-containing protein n=1 Tax=Angiostrongylus cantonensis TaxID=6313 RepID=A0A158P5Y1_ANGCA
LSKKTNGLVLKCSFVDGETEVDLLVPVESALNSDPRVFRAKGIDSLPAIGIQRGVEIAVPYRLYLPRRFFPQFSLLASVKPMDRRGGYLFAVVNPYDTLVDVGVLLEPAGSGHTNISLIYSSRRDATSRAIASFVVPEFVQQWTQIAFEVNKDSVTLYFKCIRFAEREVGQRYRKIVIDFLLALKTPLINSTTSWLFHIPYTIPSTNTTLCRTAKFVAGNVIYGIIIST